MSDRDAMKLALEALKAMQSYAAAERKGLRICDEAIEALRAALAAPKQEPVAWMYVNSEGECEQIEYGTEAIDDDSITPLYAAPPAAAPSEDIETLRRENERLRGLLTDASKAVWMNYDNDLLDRIEAALKEVPR